MAARQIPASSSSLVTVWQIEVHNGIKHKAQLPAPAFVLSAFWRQELVDVGVPDAIQLLQAMLPFMHFLQIC